MSKSKKKSKYSHPVKAWFITQGWALLARLPLRWIQALAVPVARLVWRFSARERRVSQVNVGLCFPSRTPWERDQLARAALLESTRTLLEMGWVWMAPQAKVLSSIRQVEGETLVATAQAEGRPVILLGPHFGQWEMIAQWLSSRHPFTCMFAPSRIREVDQVVMQGRGRTGCRLVPTNIKGVAGLLKALKRGEVVGILPDQEPERGQGGVFAPFFGVPALTPTLLPRLVEKTGALVLIAAVHRLPQGQGFRLCFEPVDARVYDPDEEVSATGVNASVEQLIRQNPAQYQWAYKRFRKRPPGEAKVY